MQEKAEKKPVIHVCAGLEELSIKAAETLIEVVGEAIIKDDKATVALSGGRTPILLYSLLTKDAYRNRLDWTKVHIFWGDERCVPPDHEESNYGNVLPFLKATGVPEENLHRIKGEDELMAARQYEEEVKKFFCLAEGEYPKFDLMLLGMGADGHTASIFPGTAAADEQVRIAVSVYVEKLRSTRITLTPPVLRSAKNILFLLSGPDKAEAFKNVVSEDFAPERLPAHITRQAEGRVVWFVDEQAAGEYLKSRGMSGADVISKGLTGEAGSGSRSKR